MILPLLIAAQAPVPTPVPAPPPPPTNWNYQVDCTVFAADSTSDRITGNFLHVNGYVASASLASASGRYRFDPPGTRVPVLGPGSMVVQPRQQGLRHSYFFELPAGLGENGTVRISSSTGRRSSKWVATGICAVSKTKAESP